jgi:hypothetical protein
MERKHQLLFCFEPQRHEDTKKRRNMNCLLCVFVSLWFKLKSNGGGWARGTQIRCAGQRGANDCASPPSSRERQAITHFHEMTCDDALRTRIARKNDKCARPEAGSTEALGTNVHLSNRDFSKKLNRVLRLSLAWMALPVTMTKSRRAASSSRWPMKPRTATTPTKEVPHEWTPSISLTNTP